MSLRFADEGNNSEAQNMFDNFPRPKASIGSVFYSAEQIPLNGVYIHVCAHSSVSFIYSCRCSACIWFGPAKSFLYDVW